MYYRREGRKRRLDQEFNDEQNKRPQRNRGVKFTALSFLCVIASIAVFKAVNPDMSIQSPVLMTASVALACVLMYRAGRGKKK